jgi:hypothetical protein
VRRRAGDAAPSKIGLESLYALTQPAVDVGEQSRIGGESGASVQDADVQWASRVLGERHTAVEDCLVAALVADHREHRPRTIGQLVRPPGGRRRGNRRRWTAAVVVRIVHGITPFRDVTGRVDVVSIFG